MCDQSSKSLHFALPLDSCSVCFRRHFRTTFRLWVEECVPREYRLGRKNFLCTSGWGLNTCWKEAETFFDIKVDGRENFATERGDVVKLCDFAFEFEEELKGLENVGF